MTDLEKLLKTGEEILLNAGVEEGRIDAWYLMEHVFRLNRVSFWVDKERKASPLEKCRYMEYIQKRASRIPLQYITGEQEFMGLSFHVTKDVLIPRQDTELLVEEVLKYCEDRDVLDMCTGSGCIIISLCKLGRLKSGAGCDISGAALKVAAENGEANQARVDWIQSDLFEHINKTYDIIVSNPPYIESRDIEVLMPEVKDHEPRLALDGSEDGLYYYRRLAAEGGEFLTPNGRLFLEIGCSQGEAVKGILEDNGFEQVCVKKDLCGLDRVVTGVYKG